MKFLILIFLSLSVNAQFIEEEITFDYSTLKKSPMEFDRKKLKLSGIITDLEVKRLDNNLEYYEFKLSKTSKADEYLQVTYYTKFGELVFSEEELKEKQIINLEGEYRSGFEQSDTKNLGNLYIFKDEFEKARTANIVAKKAESFIYQDSKKTDFTTIYDMAIDFTGSPSMPITYVQGYVSKVNYKEEQNGDIFWDIELKDHPKAHAKGWSDLSVTVRYYLFLRGRRFADINMDDFFVEDQQVTFKGRYLHQEKAEVNKLVGTLEMNYLDEKGKYKDFFVGTFKRNERKNVAIVSSANNDTEINQKIKSGEFDEGNIDDFEDEEF